MLHPLAVALVLGSLAVALCLLSSRWYEQYLLREARHDAVGALTPRAAALSTAIGRRAALLEGLHAFLETTPSDRVAPEFEVFAAGLHAGARDVRNFAFAPGGVIRFVYPLRGNRQALGHDLLHDPVTRDDALRAVRRRGTSLSSPYQLRQGGLGLAARQPVFRGGSFRGLATMALDLPAVFAEAGLERRTSYLLALRDSGGKVFYGERGVLAQGPVLIPVELPEGRWELAAVPRGGWRGAIGRDLLLFKVLFSLGAFLLVWGVYRGFTRHRRLQQAVLERTATLSESTEYNRALFEGSAIGLALCRMDGTLVDVNPAFAAILGRSVQEALGLSYWEITPEGYAEEERRQLETLERTGRYGPYEKEYLHRDGHAVPVRLQGRILQRAGERFIWSSVEDISERRILEGGLRERKELLKLFAEHAPAAVAMLDRDMRYLIASRRWREDFKLAEADLAGRSHYELFPNLPERFKEVHRRCLEGAVERAENDSFTLPDGTECFVRWEVRPWYASDGSIGGILIFSEDITERTQAHLAIAREHTFSEALIDSLPGVLYLYDQNLRFMRWNRNFEGVVGYSAEEIRGMTPLDFFRGPDRELVHSRIREVFATGASSVEAGFVAKDGSATPYFFTGQRLNINGTICLLGVGIDIAKRKQLEQELTALNLSLEARVQERTHDLEESRLALVNLVEDLNEKSAQLKAANQKLKEMDRLKSLFIASMSHELRTPLNSVIGYTSIVKNEWVGAVSEEQKQLLATVLRAGKHLLGLINDVIDVSKVEAGQLDVYCEEFDLFDLIAEACQQLEGEVAAKGLTLSVDNLHRPMRTDRRRLLQVVLNVLGNAVKYTEQGGIRLAAHPDGEHVEITVTDSGIGIAQDDLKLLFVPFVRIESHLHNKVSGTGLGLYLTNKLMSEVLQGTIFCTSTVAKGSTFTIRLPAQAACVLKQPGDP